MSGSERLEAGAGRQPNAPIEIDGRSLRLTNLGKALYPSGYTKAQVIDYYHRIAPALLPHLADRPLTLKRYPAGTTAASFYEKACPAHRPPWVRTAPVWSRHRGAPIDYCLVNDLASLVWVANLAAIELHPALARAGRLERPTFVVFDLDPGPPADVLDCARVALLLRRLLDGLSLDSRVKTSGRKGLQVYLPLNTPTSYEETKPFARAVAELLEGEQPGGITAVMRKDRRAGKVFIDWSQNDEHKTTIAAYSLRAADRPTVSAPVGWREVEQAVKSGRREALVFEAPDVLGRVERDGDLFAPVLALKQELPPEARRPAPRRHDASLDAYARRRHFAVTPEPAPRPRESAPGAPPRFVIHKHHARRLHYDLRLEIDGALASWAVPRGPSNDPSHKRLAVATEDHPLEYGDFEGRIPEGEYGAGDSLVWDRGSWDTIPPGEAAAQRERGHLHFELRGEKLRGRWHLVRTGRRGGAATPTSWLLFKAGDGAARPGSDVVADRPESVLSGRAATRGPQSARALRGHHPPPAALLNRVFPPMLATVASPARSPPGGEDEWIYEVKYDGFRCLAGVSSGRVAMWSRKRQSLAGRFPRVARALGGLIVAEAVIDGEIVAFDAPAGGRGRSRFEGLQRGEAEEMVCFDLLWLDGRDLRGEPLHRRRDLLASLLAGAAAELSLAERIPGPAQAALAVARGRSLEGLIAKRRGAAYEGRRSRHWLKLKLFGREEVTIVGYTTIAGASSEIGALLVAVPHGGRLTYAGKVGTGFTTAMRKELRRLLGTDAIDQPAFTGAPRMKRVTFVAPRHVAEVRFVEWTAGGAMRQPAFVGLAPRRH